MPNSDYFEMNRIGWDRRAQAHVESTFYDVEGFLAGNTSLREIELLELGEVTGRSLLHLQCLLVWIRSPGHAWEHVARVSIYPLSQSSRQKI